MKSPRPDTAASPTRSGYVVNGRATEIIALYSAQIVTTTYRADVLILGAGPAGSTAAIDLAKGGARVVLVDRRTFPRDKVCGDALIPDALQVLDHLSLKQAVLTQARVFNRIRIYAPNERFVDIAGECACLPRVAFDEIIRTEAVRCGAQFFPNFSLRRPLVSLAAVKGATFTTHDHRLVTIEANFTVLATGASAEALKAFDVCTRVTPSATAARIYVRADANFASAFDHLCISYDQAICPGYGWIFPGPNHVFNVGVGYYYDAKRQPPETNIRVLLNRFLTTFPPAVELMRGSQSITSLRGAPLRTALAGARLGRPGLLVIGEAAGLTYSFSGEGIGKAMESGAIAAAVILKHLKERPESDASEEYSARIHAAFAARFRAYKIAQDRLSNPTLANILAWRANRSSFVKRQLEGLFQETADPRQLFSVTGALRSLFS